MKRGSLSFNVFGAVLIFFPLISFFNQLYLSTPEGVLWFCYIGSFLSGIAILIRSSKLLASQLYILSVPAIFWSVDFLLLLFFDFSPFGISGYFFSPSNSFVSMLISLQHLIVVPVGFYFLFFLKGSIKGSLYISFFQVFLIFFITLFFTPLDSNINCVRDSCTSISLGLPYTISWFFGISFSIMITYVVLWYFSSKW